MTRTDVHSPANLVTEDYEYVFCGDNSPEEGCPGWSFGFTQSEEGLAYLREIVAGLDKSPVADRNIYQCHHCGARIRYFALLRHLPTQAIIAVGETCLDNRFGEATTDFHKIRKAAQLDREAHRIKTAALEQLATLDPDVVDCLAKKDPETYINEFTQAARQHHIVSDIRSKLWKYGSISVGQLNLIGKLILQEQAKVDQQAAREVEVKVPAPQGRITFTGTVVSRKFKDSDYGGAWKITIKVETEAGIWLAWVSEPSSIGPRLYWDEENRCHDIPGAEPGTVVTLTANLTRSDQDEAFAFGKRPTKAVIVSRPNQTEES